MSQKKDVIIIGAGILGCFAARELSRYDLSIAVLEKREDVCTEITRANTGIIYRGYDQHPGSLKAALCQAASAKFPKLCEELDVGYRNTGLLMLSFGPKADKVLQKKLQRGLNAGMNGLSILDGAEVHRMEPNLCGDIQHALYAENTYTVNPWELGIAAYENATANGVEFRFCEEVVRMMKKASEAGYVIETDQGEYEADYVIATAGMNGSKVWEMVYRPRIRLVPMEADYLIFDNLYGNKISHVISVEPEEKGEGLTLVPTVNGNIMAGPTRRTAGSLPDYATERNSLEELIVKVMNLVPSLSKDGVIRSFGAVRPNPFEVWEENGQTILSDKSINDFALLEEENMLCMVGVKTPGITCASKLGALAAEKAVKNLGRGKQKSDFIAERSSIKRTLQNSKDENQKILSGDEIICRCNQVTRAEVIEAIRRGATTINGVKRRTGAGMGRCQGGVCMEKILHILSEETGRDIYDITLDGKGTEILGAF